MEEATAQNVTDWQWKIQPADLPHGNGGVGATVRILKKAVFILSCIFETWMSGYVH